MENMPTATAPITAIAILNSTTMYGTQRPDAEVTKVPHSGHTKVRLA
jgi:hypothetical protein